MKKLVFATACFLTCVLFLPEAQAQTLPKTPSDSLAIENFADRPEKDTSFHCNFGGEPAALFVYPGRHNRTGFKNQNMRIISNRDFRNLNMGITISGYSYF